MTTCESAGPLCDPDLTLCVRDILWHSGYSDLRSIDVKPIPGGVQLLGTVRSYYLKQIAQSLAIMIEGVVDVDNQMEVT